MTIVRKTIDKRIFEIRAERPESWRNLAISADATFEELHLALFASFLGLSGFADGDPGYRFILGGTTYAGGRGSRTALRRRLDLQDTFDYASGDGCLALTCRVVASGTVPTRRHYPKVRETSGDGDAQTLTWEAQYATSSNFRSKLRHTRARPPFSDAFLEGFFTAAISGPVVLPSEWIGLFVDLNHVRGAGEANSILQQHLAHYNRIARVLQERPDDFRARMETMADDPTGTVLREWTRGYVRAVELRADDWIAAIKDPEFERMFEPIAASMDICNTPEKRDWLRDDDLRRNLARALGIASVELRERWRKRLFPSPNAPVRRAAPKTSPNAPCPCNSGKKYKRCCGSPLRVVN